MRFVNTPVQVAATPGGNAHYLAAMSGAHNTAVTGANAFHALPRVAYQGAPGAFSELAIRQYWPDGAIAVPQPTFDAAVECALKGDAHFAMIPVENVIAGPVKAALEVLERARHRFVMLGETRLNVEMCLMARSGSDITLLRTVLSHHMALAQCNTFFTEHPWLQAVVHGDTASAAADVARGDAENAAALASAAAAECYGLEILARNVQDMRDNWTRFVVIAANDYRNSPSIDR